MKHLLFSLSAMTLFISHASAEQFFKGKVEDGPHIGLVTAGDSGTDSLAYGWHAQYNQNSYFSWEFALTAHNDEVDTGTSSSLPASAGFDLDDYALSLSLRLNLIANDPVNFYVGAGFNYHIFEEEIDTSTGIANLASISPEVKDTLGYHVSLGLEYLLSEKWELFLEGQYVILSPEVVLNTTVNGGNGQLVSSQFRGDLDYNYLLLRLGINYRF